MVSYEVFFFFSRDFASVLKLNALVDVMLWTELKDDSWMPPIVSAWFIFKAIIKAVMEMALRDCERVSTSIKLSM